MYLGVTRFVTGLTKKVVFADRIGVAVNAVFAAPAAYNGLSIAMAVMGYSLQIYCDFSGDSDMAIGIAAIWDFDLGKTSICPIWRKTHRISGGVGTSVCPAGSGTMCISLWAAAAGAS